MSSALAATTLAALCVLALVPPAAAQVYDVGPGQVALDGADGERYAITVVDDAACHRAPCLAATGAGHANGTVAIAGLVEANATDCRAATTERVCASAALVGVGRANGTLAVAGNGIARGTQGCVRVPYGGVRCTGGVAIAGIGDAHGQVAVVLGGRAYGGASCPLDGLAPVCLPGVAAAGGGESHGNVSVIGNGDAQGDLVGVSLLGDATGQVAISGTGQAQGGTLSVSGCALTGVCM